MTFAEESRIAAEQWATDWVVRWSSTEALCILQQQQTEDESCDTE